MSQAELDKTTEQLAQQQGLLGPLAADPSLRGVMRVLTLGARGVKSGDAKLEDLEKPMGQIDGTLQKVLAGKPARMSWQELLSSGESQRHRHAEVRDDPAGAGLQRAAARLQATKLIRNVAKDLKIDAAARPARCA